MLASKTGSVAGAMSVKSWSTPLETKGKEEKELEDSGIRLGGCDAKAAQSDVSQKEVWQSADKPPVKVASEYEGVGREVEPTES